MKIKKKKRFAERGWSATRELCVPAPKPTDYGHACTHGGFLIGKVLVCGYCGDEELQLGHALMFIARRCAFEATGKYYAEADLVGEIAVALALNKDRILREKNPGGVATTIGRRAALRYFRDGGGDSVESTPASQLVPEKYRGMTDAQSLDFVNKESVREEQERDWRDACGSRTLPGLSLIMNAANLEWLRRVIEEGRQKISLAEWLVIRLRLGLDDDEPRTWREISKVSPFKFNELPEVYRRALSVLHDHIVERLSGKVLSF